jgi:hypothetical protein
VLPTVPGSGVAALAKVDETRAALNAVAIMPDHFKDFFIYLSFVHNWKYVLRVTLNKCKFLYTCLIY